MDWTKQAEETVKAWTDTQQKMWDSWLEMLGTNPVPAQANELWQKTMATWQEAVKNTLEAQTKWTETWAENLSKVPNMPKESVEWVKQAREMNKRWTEAQRQLWESWFELVGKIDPAKMNEGWDKEGKKLFETWQDSAQKLMEAQMKWAQTWGNGEAEVKNANAKKQKA
jgi:hypothetical protein